MLTGWPGDRARTWSKYCLFTGWPGVRAGTWSKYSLLTGWPRVRARTWSKYCLFTGWPRVRARTWSKHDYGNVPKLLPGIKGTIHVIELSCIKGTIHVIELSCITNSIGNPLNIRLNSIDFDILVFLSEKLPDCRIIWIT